MLTELPYLCRQQQILEEVDNDYGLPTARYRAPTDYPNNSLVEDMGGAVWRSLHALGCWEHVPHPGLDDDWGVLLKPDTFFDPWANTGNVRQPPIELDSDGKWIA